MIYQIIKPNHLSLHLNRFVLIAVNTGRLHMFFNNDVVLEAFKDARNFWPWCRKYFLVISIFNIARQGYCNHFVCLYVCLSVCLSVCLFSVCPQAIYIYTYYATHGTLHGTLWCYIMKRSCLFWGKGECSGVLRWGEVRWGFWLHNVTLKLCIL